MKEFLEYINRQILLFEKYIYEENDETELKVLKSGLESYKNIRDLFPFFQEENREKIIKIICSELTGSYYAMFTFDSRGNHKLPMKRDELESIVNSALNKLQEQNII